MNIEKLKEIAARYDFVIALSEEEKQMLERNGYELVNFDFEELLPELFIPYDPKSEFYEKDSEIFCIEQNLAFRFAA